MQAVFIELPAFARYRQNYLDDSAFCRLQQELLRNPDVGVVIKATGGLRKARFKDHHRGKGKRGGIRVIYYWWSKGNQFWLFTLYSKDEMADLSERERNVLAVMLKDELQVRDSL